MSAPTPGDLLTLSLRREWMVQRERFLDYAAVALVVVAFLDLDVLPSFTVIGTCLAASLGAARIGGAETIAGTWEFALTRPVSRADWFAARFTSGLVVLAALLAVVLAADLAGLPAAVGALLADRVAAASPAGGPDLVGYFAAVSFQLAVYALSFRFAIRETRPEQVLSHRASGVILAILALVAVQVLAAVGQLAPPLAPTWKDAAGPPGGWLVAAPMLLVAGLATASARAAARDREVGAAEVPATQRRGGGSGALVAVVLLLLVVAALAFLLLTPTRVEPVVQATFEGR